MRSNFEQRAPRLHAELEITSEHLRATWALPSTNVHAIRQASSPEEASVEHCPTLASGRFKVFCWDNVLEHCNVSRNRNDQEREACKMCTRDGIPEQATSTSRHASRVIMSMDLQTGASSAGGAFHANTGSSVTDLREAPTHQPIEPSFASAERDGSGSTNAWHIRGLRALLHTYGDPGVPSALRSFYVQWGKFKTCMNHVRSLERSLLRRFEFVVKTRPDVPFFRGPALSSLQNPTLLYLRYRCAAEVMSGSAAPLIPSVGYQSAGSRFCLKGAHLPDDQFVIAPRGGTVAAMPSTPSDALASIADLPCPATDTNVQNAIRSTCSHNFWAECFMSVALKATRQRGRLGPIMVTLGRHGNVRDDNLALTQTGLPHSKPLVNFSLGF